MRAPFPTREMLEMDDRAGGDLPPRTRYEITGSTSRPQRTQERNDPPPPYSHNDALGQLPVMPVIPVLSSGIQARPVRAGPSRPDTLSPPPYPVLSQLERRIFETNSFFDGMDPAYDAVIMSELRLKVKVTELEAKVIEMQTRIDTHDIEQRVRTRRLEVAETRLLQVEEGRVAAEAKLRTLEARGGAARSGLCESCQEGGEPSVELSLINEFQRLDEVLMSQNMPPWAAELREILGIPILTALGTPWRPARRAPASRPPLTRWPE
ncbi:hypothetical protein CspHIS471_0703410 [Cutaneotrichosporon sp. HIS471]|nr:hypothetical protein CspHIS471_0703410 [Cutaneotrichosporon sp. HIS471]